MFRHAIHCVSECMLAKQQNECRKNMRTQFEKTSVYSLQFGLRPSGQWNLFVCENAWPSGILWFSSFLAWIYYSDCGWLFMACESVDICPITIPLRILCFLVWEIAIRTHKYTATDECTFSINKPFFDPSRFVSMIECVCSSLSTLLANFYSNVH